MELIEFVQFNFLYRSIVEIMFNDLGFLGRIERRIMMLISKRSVKTYLSSLSSGLLLLKFVRF